VNSKIELQERNLNKLVSPVLPKRIYDTHREMNVNEALNSDRSDKIIDITTTVQKLNGNETSRKPGNSVLDLLSNLGGLTPAGLKHLMEPQSTKNTLSGQSNSSLLNSRARVVSPASNYLSKNNIKDKRNDQSLSSLSSTSALTAKRLNQSELSLHFSDVGSEILKPPATTTT